METISDKFQTLENSIKQLLELLEKTKQKNKELESQIQSKDVELNAQKNIIKEAAAKLPIFEP